MAATTRGRFASAVPALRALVRIPTVSRPDPPTSTPRPSRRSSPSSSAGSRSCTGSSTTGARPRAARALARPLRRAPGRADGAPRRRAGRGRLAAPGLRRRPRRRRGLGPRHPRRQGPAGGDLRGRRVTARGRRVPAQDVWLSFGCTEEVSGDGAPRRSSCCGSAGCGRGSCSTRAAPSPTARSRASRPDRGRRGHREGRHLDRAAGRGPRRARLHPGPARPDRPAGPRDHPPRPLPHARLAARAHRRAVPADGPARTAAAAAADRRRPARPGAGRGPWWPPDRSPPR